MILASRFSSWSKIHSEQANLLLHRFSVETVKVNSRRMRRRKRGFTTAPESVEEY